MKSRGRSARTPTLLFFRTAYFNVGIDEVRLYSRALGPTEVAALAKSGAVKFTTSSVNLQQGSTLTNGLRGHWTFDGPDVTTTTVLDRSGLGNTVLRAGATAAIGELGQALSFDGVDDELIIEDADDVDVLQVVGLIVCAARRSRAIQREVEL